MDTVLEFLLYFLYGVGAFMAWMAKGCKTKFKDELSKKHQIRNSAMAILLFVILFGLLVYVMNHD